jgi:putative tryptophan/tyrosine transport system substrate-binding protein
MRPIRRRELIAGLGGAAAWPLATRAQQRERVRRVGILSPGSENDPENQSRFAVVIQELARLDWVEGRNLRIDRRWTNNDADLTAKFAKELVGLQPDVIL